MRWGLDRVVRVVFSKEVAFEQTPERSEAPGNT